MNSGNLLEVAKALRAHWPQREILIAADNDQFTEGNPGQTKAVAAAKAIAARLAMPRFKELTSQPTDFNDLAALETLAVIREQLSATQTPKESDSDTFARLAALEKEDYERVREAEARNLGFRVGVLDELVQDKRPRASSGGRGENLQGVAVKLVDVEPWPEPVDGAEVLDAISRRFDRYVVMPEGAADMDALWCAHTYMYRLF
jgi:putative DNA primase/helicase